MGRYILFFGVESTRWELGSSQGKSWDTTILSERQTWETMSVDVDDGMAMAGI